MSDSSILEKSRSNAGPLTAALIATLLVVSGVALRLWGIEGFVFDQDELYTVVEATRLLDSPLRPGIEGRPFYYVLQHWLLLVTPETAQWLRMPSLVFGVAGMVVTWRLARRVAGEGAGLVALALIAVSPWHLYASGLARYWSLVYLCAAGFWLAFDVARERDSALFYVVALLALAVGALSHPTFFFPLPAAIAAAHLVVSGSQIRVQWPSRNAWKWLWGPFVIVLLSWWIWLSSIDRAVSVRNFDGRGLIATLRLLPAMVQWMGPTVAAVAGGGAVIGLSGNRRVGGWCLIAAAGIVCSVLLLVAASTVTDVYADYGMAFLPFVFVLGGVFVSEVSIHLNGVVRRSISAVSMVGIVYGGVLPSTVSHLSDGTRFDYRPAFERVESVAPEVLVVTTPLIQRNHYAPSLRASELEPRTASLDSLLTVEQDLWVVASAQRSGYLADYRGELRHWLRASCKFEESWERPRLDYRVYRVELYRCRLAGT